jgi:hypothetical protein
MRQTTDMAASSPDPGGGFFFGGSAAISNASALFNIFRKANSTTTAINLDLFSLNVFLRYDCYSFRVCVEDTTLGRGVS